MDTSVYDPKAKDLQPPPPPPPPYSETPGGTGVVNPSYVHDTPNLTTEEETAVHVGFTVRNLDEASVRRGFIRKVYLILTAQLAFTFGCVLLTALWAPVAEAIRSNLWIFYASLAVFTAVYIGLMCSTRLRRETPGNMIALFIFTLAMTAMASTLAAFTSSNAVLVSVGITGAVCVGVTLFVLQSRVEFSLLASLIYSTGLVFAMFGVSCLITILVYRRSSLDPVTTRILDCVYGGLIALLLVVCLVADTHHVIGNSNYGLSEEEYVFGALQLYIDVVLVLMIFLGIRGGR
ncbi:hypothetical protein BOX15_Mlig019836g3 [Macrostomum lignano]|uniref:Uncharacterized protein n=1 Tax=Macrostomum lignano TaxID=282301 RepID=A0A267DFZ1_9PLAT|nr:hypothetical protein BOX15_Mlig019836g3 [Macrostomum lignano]